ncbi:MAG: hypothetical protein RLW61_04645 [Gammaproteobacteria bacterium]
MSSKRREKIIAGEVCMLANELSSLTTAALRRIYREVGDRQWQTLALLFDTKSSPSEEPR